MTLVPHRCACPGQPGAQLPTDIWGAGALQPSKGLGLPQSCHKLTGLSPSLTPSGLTGVGMQPQLRNNHTSRDPHSALPISAESPNHPQPKPHHLLQPPGPMLSAARLLHGRGWEKTHSERVPAQLAGFASQPSLPQGSSRFAEDAQHPSAAPSPPPGAGQAPAHQTSRSQSILLHLGPFHSQFPFKECFSSTESVSTDNNRWVILYCCYRNNEGLLHLTVFQRPSKLERYFTCTPGRGHTLNGYFEKH